LSGKSIFGFCLAAALAAAACEATSKTAPVAMADPAWRGAERLAIVCSVDSGEALGHEQMARELCTSVAAVARSGAPVDVQPVSMGDAARASDAVLLLVHAGVAPASAAVPGARGRVLSFTMRTSRSGPLSSAPALFGAPPRVAPYGETGNGQALLNEALRASLSQVLPWISRAEESSFQPLIKPQE
jgi:hypothetical protein